MAFIPAIILQGIVIFQIPHIYLMICNNCRILVFDFLPINHNSIFFLTLRNSKIQNGWHHHSIVIRIIKNKNIKPCLVPFTTKTSHITNIFDLKQSLMPYPWALLVQYRLFLSMHFHKLPSYLFFNILLRKQKTLSIFTSIPVPHRTIISWSMSSTVFILVLVSNSGRPIGIRWYLPSTITQPYMITLSPQHKG